VFFDQQPKPELFHCNTFNYSWRFFVSHRVFSLGLVRMQRHGAALGKVRIINPFPRQNIKPKTIYRWNISFLWKMHAA